MIKATARGKDGRDLVVLGITDMNIARMREGKPIHVLAEEVGLSGFTLFIIAGKDEAELAKTLGPLIKPGHTEVVDHRAKGRHAHQGGDRHGAFPAHWDDHAPAW